MGLSYRKDQGLTILENDARSVYGVQEPTHLLVPPAAANSGDEAIELAESVGLYLDPWQQTALRASLGETVDGMWAAFEFGLEVARQNGKGAIIEARQLAGLFLFGERLILHSAHDFKTCSEAFRRLLGWIEGSPDLSRRVKRVATANGKESIELHSGQRIRFVARSKGSGRGFTGDLIILDESMILSADAVAAMMPTLAARPNPQIWYTGSAPFADSEVWHSVRRRAMGALADGSVGRLAWCGWESDPNVDASDRDSWARVNPAIGHRITWDYLEAEFAAMDGDSHGRERLSVVEPEPGTIRVFGDGVWETAAADVGAGVPVITGPVVVGFDVSPSGDRSSIGVAGVNGEGFQVEVVDSRLGTVWLFDRLVELVERHEVRAIVRDVSGKAGGVSLVGVGVEVVDVASRDHARAVSAFMAGVGERTVTHLGQPVLDAAVLGAKTRPLADAEAWARRKSDADITPLVAVTLALGSLMTLEPEELLMDLADMVRVI